MTAHLPNIMISPGKITMTANGGIMSGIGEIMTANGANIGVIGAGGKNTLESGTTGINGIETMKAFSIFALATNLISISTGK